MLRYASSRWVMGAAAGHWDEMEMDDITLKSFTVMTALGNVRVCDALRETESGMT